MAAEFKIGRLRYNWAGAWTSGNIYEFYISYDNKATWNLVYRGLQSQGQPLK